jgi:beta-galactosidase GanA
MSDFHMPKPPYLGAAYYPEDWPDDQIDRDVEKMRRHGITAVRIGEFAWHRMEPAAGEFDFSYFKTVVKKLKAAGIAVVLGTPTATPPIWLSKLYPDVLREEENGRTHSHGGRRHCCSNNPHYVEYSLRVVRKMAEAFADEEAILGWQIDNEIYEWGNGCFCDDCKRAFEAYLRNKYGTIGALNEAWNLNLFSQWYDDFSQVPAPRDAWHNPHLQLEYKTFQNDSHIAFVRGQAAALREYVSAPIGTDTMPFNAMDYRRMNETLDVVQFNHYNTRENLWQVCLWFDYLRTLKDRPFWNTETATCWNGSTEITQSVKPEGFCRVNSWMPIALGGEANMYWLWRTHWAGHELMHGAVLDASGRPMHIVREVERVSREFERASEFLRATRVSSEIALHFTSKNWIINATQRVVKSLNYMEALDEHFYKPLIDAGLRPDVVDAAQPLDGYRLIVSPMMMTMDEHDLQARMLDWVKGGGVWIAGPLTDVRDERGARYRDRPFGVLEELTGAQWLYNVPDIDGVMGARWTDGDALGGSPWYEMYEDRGGEVLARAEAPHSALNGKAVLLKCRVGKGVVYLLGALPDARGARKLIELAARDAGIALPQLEGAVLAVPRAGDGVRGLILIEHAGEAASYRLDRPMTDILTGERLSGALRLEPYAVRVLQEA